MIGLPRRRGSSRCSTDAKNASRSACRIVASPDDDGTRTHVRICGACATRARGAELPDSGDELVAGSRRPSRPCRRRRRREPEAQDGASPRHAARQVPRSCARGAPPGPARCGPTTTAPRPSRRPPSWSPSSGDRCCGCGRPSRRGAGARARRDVAADFGHIDVLVNDIWGGEMLKGGPSQWNVPIWSSTSTTAFASSGSPSTRTSSRRTTCCRCWRTSPEAWWSRSPTAPATTTRRGIAFSVLRPRQGRGEPARVPQGHELAAFGATAVAITPGWMRSEIMLETFRRDRGVLARLAGTVGRWRWSLGTARLRVVGVAAFRWAGRRRAGIGSRSRPLEPAVGRLGPSRT